MTSTEELVSQLTEEQKKAAVPYLIEWLEGLAEGTIEPGIERGFGICALFDNETRIPGGRGDWLCSAELDELVPEWWRKEFDFYSGNSMYPVRYDPEGDQPEYDKVECWREEHGPRDWVYCGLRDSTVADRAFKAFGDYMWDDCLYGDARRAYAQHCANYLKEIV